MFCFHKRVAGNAEKILMETKKNYITHKATRTVSLKGLHFKC